MKITYNPQANKRAEPVPEGSYVARIYSIIHIGTVAGFQGKLQDKVRLTFEFPTELKVFNAEKGEQPRVMSQEYTVSLNEKATLRKVIEACSPKSLNPDEEGFINFELEDLIGKVCLATIKHKTNDKGTFAFIDNVTVLPKGMVCPLQINPTQVLTYENWNEELFAKQPDFIKEKMQTSEEYKKLHGLDTKQSLEDLDSPF